MVEARHNRPWRWPEDGPGHPVPGATIPELLDHCAKHHALAPAVVQPGVSLGWAALHAQAEALAGDLLAGGLRPGDHVLHALPNSVELMVLAHACLRGGLPLVCAGPLRPGPDLAEVCRLTRPKLAVLVDWHAGALGRRRILGPDCRQVLTTSLAGQLQGWARTQYQAKVLGDRMVRAWGRLPTRALALGLGVPAAPLPPLPRPTDTALLLPTPGVDGPTKIVMLSHGNVAANTAQIAEHSPAAVATQRFVSILPMDHAYGFFFSLALPTRYAASCWPVVPLQASKIHALEEAIRAARPTVLPMVPALIIGLLDHLEHHPNPETLAALAGCHVFSGAAALPPKDAERWHRLTGVHIIEGFGCSESSPITHANLYQAPRPGHIGPPIPGTVQRLAAPDDPQRDAGPGSEGELWVRGPQVFQGYLGDAAATDALLARGPDGETWLRTGDFGVAGADGVVRLTRPRPKMINHGGYKVWPERVRLACLTFPGVREAVISARPHRVHTQEMHAAITWAGRLSERGRQKLEKRLRAHLQRELANYELPRRLSISSAGNGACCPHSSPVTP